MHEVLILKWEKRANALKSAANILTHNLTSSLTYTLINSQNNSEITNFLGHFLIPNWRIMVSVLAPTPYY